MKTLIALGLIFTILPKYGICPYPFSDPYEEFSHSEITLSNDGVNNFATTTISNTGDKVLDLNFVTLISNQDKFNYLVDPKENSTSFILPTECRELTFNTYDKVIDRNNISFQSQAYDTTKYVNPGFQDLTISSYETSSNGTTYQYSFKLNEETYNLIKDYHITFFVKASDKSNIITSYQHAGPNNEYVFESNTKLDENTFKIDELHVAKGLPKDYNKKDQIIFNWIIAGVVLGVILLIGLITMAIVMPIVILNKHKKTNKSN